MPRFCKRLVAALASAALMGLCNPSSARTASTLPPGEIALTFDDLPGLSLVEEQSYVDHLNRKLLQGLKRHHFPATGFVNEGKLDELLRDRQTANLVAWLDAGMDLGNHTLSHESPNTLGAAAYIADIAQGEVVTRSLLEARHRPLQWFRHPYLETGTPEATRMAIESWLGQHGYRIAPVTMNAEDWEFAEPYDDATARHDKARQRLIRTQYLEHTAAAIGWYRQASQDMFGRQIRFIILLHATRLNADCLDALAAILKRQHLKPVSLAKAMADPAYRTPDPYAGADGIDWIERWSLTLHKDLRWEQLHEPPKQIAEDYDRLDHDRH